jgi:hypothetical protein
MLRRLDDEPLAVPDRVTDHLDRCERCTARRAEIALDTERAAELLSAPQLVPDIDVAWARIQRDLAPGPDQAGRPRPTPVLGRRAARFPRISLRAALIIGAVGVIVAGTAAAATVTTIFAPTHVAPVSVSQRDLHAIADLTGLGNAQSAGGFATQRGSRTLGFGTVTWSSGAAHTVRSLAQASADGGFAVTLPAHLPAGVGGVRQFVFQPGVKATVSFNAKAANVANSSVTIEAGPAVVAEYSGASRTDGPTLAVATMRRPTAQATGASLSEIEAFLLSRPGIPPQMAEEIRLLGDLRTILPVPVPPGASVSSVQVGGWPGVLLADASNAAAGVVWEDGQGLLHGVVGILDPQDVMNVANQLG